MSDADLDFEDDAGATATAMPPEPEPSRQGNPYSDEPTTEMAPANYSFEKEAAGRQEPHDAKAEEHVIACCFIDGKETVAKCLEKRLTGAAFYIPSNRVIFERIVSVYERDGKAPIEVVAADLSDRGEFEEIGGMPYLLQVSSVSPTTAQADFFIERVRNLHLSRQLIKVSTSAVEQCYLNPTASAEIAERAEAEMARLTKETRAGGIAHTLSGRRFDPSKSARPARAIFRIGDVPICTAGNISNLVAQAKAGKSAIVGAMIAAAMCIEVDRQDCFGIRAANDQGLALLHFDTEQSVEHWDGLLRRALRRAQGKQFPLWLHSYSLAGLAAVECRQAVDWAIQNARDRCGGIFAVIIDGIGDLVVDPNDPEECFPLVTHLHALAIEFDAPIINVLHLNPGSMEKSRGHLGSQLERKAETNLTLEKAEDGATVLFALKQRGAMIPKETGPRFRWSDADDMHVSTASIRSERAEEARETLGELAREAFGDRPSLTFSALKEAVKIATLCSDRTATRRIKEMCQSKVVRRAPPNLYELAP